MLQTAYVLIGILTLVSTIFLALLLREFRKLVSARNELLCHFGGCEKHVRFGNKTLTLLYVSTTILISGGAFLYAFFLF